MPFAADAAAGFAAGAWIYGLWFVAPLLTLRAEVRIERYAAALALGVALPFALGFAHLLYGATLWLALVVLAALRVRRFGLGDAASDETKHALDVRAVAIALGIAVALAAPPLVRPLMDGDTTIYHLPLAAAYVRHHGIWTTGTRYWWYPGASELFAAGIFATSGIRDVGFAGVAPGTLLIWRVASAAPRAHRLTATLAGCALVASGPAAQQLVSLQNDLWQAALLLEFAVARDLRGGAMLALVKPSGIVYAALAAVRSGWTSALAFVPFVLWIARDALLWRSALVPPQTTFVADAWRTALAFHLPEAVSQLPAALASAGAAWCIVVALSCAGLVLTRDVQLRYLWMLAVAAFLCAPFGFTNGTPQFVTGQSLRFALPAVAIGIYALVSASRGRALIVALASALACVLGVERVWRTYATDAMTFGTPGFVVLAVLGYMLVVRGKRGRLAALPFALAVAATIAAVMNGAHPVAYFAERYGSASGRTQAFHWVAARRVARLLALGVPAGAFVATSPLTDVGDASGAAVACGEARRQQALLVISAAENVRCAPVVYHDEAMEIVAPVEPKGSGP